MWCPIAALLGPDLSWSLRVSLFIAWASFAPLPFKVRRAMHLLLSVCAAVAIICLDIVQYSDTTIFNSIAAAPLASFCRAFVANRWPIGLTLMAIHWYWQIVPQDQLEVTDSAYIKDQQPSAATTTTFGSKVGSVTKPSCGSAHNVIIKKARAAV